MTLLIAIISIANAISELSNQGKLSFLSSPGHVSWWDGYNRKTSELPLWKQKFPFVIFIDAFHLFKTVWLLTALYGICTPTTPDIFQDWISMQVPTWAETYTDIGYLWFVWSIFFSLTRKFFPNLLK